MIREPLTDKGLKPLVPLNRESLYPKVGTIERKALCIHVTILDKLSVFIERV